MLGYKKVYKINDRLVIGNNIEDAISIFSEWVPGREIERVELITADSCGLITNAICREDN